MDKRKVQRITLLVLGVGAIFVLILSSWPLSKEVKKVDVKKVRQQSTTFKKEGELLIISSEGDTLKSVDIEIADNDYEITQGLMFRKSMAENRGMLFIQPDERPQSFWMRNTHISLDIIFINSSMEIVSAQEYTTPYSEESLPSEGPAIYILEVNAGSMDKWGVKPGDKVSFKRV